MLQYFDTLCWQCIHIMERMSALTGISYGAINVILFIIINPIAIFLFMAAAAYALAGKRRTAKVFFIIGSTFIAVSATLIITTLCLI